MARNITRSDVVQLLADAYKNGLIGKDCYCEMMQEMNGARFEGALKVSMHGYVQLYVQFPNYEMFKQWMVR